MDIETILWVVSFVLVVLFFGTRKLGLDHQRAAVPLHQLIVLVFGSLALACVVGGIIAILHNAKSETELEIFGAHLATGHVGVAFVGIGLIIGYFTVRAVLRSQRDLATLPPDDSGNDRGRDARLTSRSTRTRRKRRAG